MTEYVVSWHASGTTIIEAESEVEAQAKIYKRRISEVCKDADTIRIGSVDEYYEIPEEAP
jgi:hypothetical protein